MSFSSLYSSFFPFYSSVPQRLVVSLPTSSTGPDGVGAVRHQQPAQVRGPEHQPDAPQNQQNQQGKLTPHPLKHLQ